MDNDDILTRDDIRRIREDMEKIELRIDMLELKVKRLLQYSNDIFDYFSFMREKGEF